MPVDSTPTPQPPAKKAAIEATPPRSATSNAANNNQENINGNVNAKNSTGKTFFQRVKADEVEFEDDRLRDNSFLAKPNAENCYGFKAHQDLIVTRGKGFTKEKNKKKRGSYRGGKIDLGQHSVKFQYSDDE